MPEALLGFPPLTDMKLTKSKKEAEMSHLEISDSVAISLSMWPLNN
jgi:hypothetical protein